MAARIIECDDQGEVRLYEDSANGTNYVGHKAAASVTSTYAVEWPAAPPGSTLFMTMTDAGVIGFATPSTTLDDAYTNGQTIAVDAGEIDISGSASRLMHLQQTGNQSVLFLEKTGTGAGTPLQINDGGVGTTLSVTKTGSSGSPLIITGATHSFSISFAGLLDQQVNAASEVAVFTKLDSGAEDVIQILSSGSGHYIDTDAGAGTPAHLTNSGVWTDASSWRGMKENFEAVDYAAMLDGVLEMRLERFTVISDRVKGVEDPIRHFHPYQDDMVGLFGCDPRGFRSAEVGAVALGAIKGLVRRLEAKGVL